ncbi:SDR family oxidoreductase [Candidatus Woesearchaeota archaeon]|nr:SDR family oxidoreductase [Candidatus Woesearchaeota archaeon]
MEDLKKKHVLITGAASGIGKATALLLASKGANLLLLDKDYSSLDIVHKYIGSNCPACKTCFSEKCDIRDEKQVKKTIAKFVKNCGKIDVLINNAGILDYGKVYEQDPKKWANVINTNLIGTFLVSRHVLPYMIKRKKGHVINLSSIYGKHASPDSSAYCASKFGIRGLSQSMRQEVDKYNIRVTIVHPSTTQTNLFKGTPFKPNPKKALLPEDIAQTIYSTIIMRENAVIEEVDPVPLLDPYKK